MIGFAEHMTVEEVEKLRAEGRCVECGEPLTSMSDHDLSVHNDPCMRERMGAPSIEDAEDEERLNGVRLGWGV